MSETPHLRWFDAHPRCRCGAPSAGVLRGVANASYGHHCKRCADRRLKDSEKVRAKEAAALAAALEAAP